MAAGRISDKRPWTFYALATLFGAFLMFLYGPMFVIYVLSFQGPNGGVTFPMVGTSLEWFREVFEKGQMANLPVSFERSISLAAVVSGLLLGVRSQTFWLLSATFFICGLSTNGLIGTHLIPAAIDHHMSAVRGASLLAVIGVFDVIGTTCSGSRQTARARRGTSWIRPC